MNRTERRSYIPDDLCDRIRSEYVTSPRHLQLVMDIALPIGPYTTINHIYRSFLWLLYSGMDADMTLRVAKEDLDFLRMKARVPNGYTGYISQHLYKSSTSGWLDYPIYAEAVYDLRMACDLTHFYEPGRAGGAERRYVRSAGFEILRGKKRGENQDDYQRLNYTIRPAIQKAFEQMRKRYDMPDDPLPIWFPINLTPKKVERSGKFFRAYTEERMGVPIWMDPHQELQEVYQIWKSLYRI